MNIWNDTGAAWPVANPVITCGSLSDAGVPSNFVADPFLYEQVPFILLAFSLYTCSSMNHYGLFLLKMFVVE